MATKEFKNADSLLSVTLLKNNLSPSDNSFIGHVTRNVLTLSNLIANIAEKNEGLSSYTIEHSANLLSDEILKACRSGYAVDVLGLGTLYIALSGAVTGEKPNGSSIPGFKICFSPSAKMRSMAENIKVDKIVFADSAPSFDKIINVFDQNEKHILKKGKGVRIIGTKLKIMGDDAGIWFAPVDEQNEAIKDETKWVLVSSTTISMNKPKTLEFYVPDELEDGNYRLVVKTRCGSGDKLLKSLATGFSSVVNVVS